jgi:hypothetical protein
MIMSIRRQGVDSHPVEGRREINVLCACGYHAGAAGEPAGKRHDLDHQRDARPRDGDDKQDAHGG